MKIQDFHQTTLMNSPTVVLTLFQNSYNLRKPAAVKLPLEDIVAWRLMLFLLMFMSLNNTTTLRSCNNYYLIYWMLCCVCTILLMCCGTCMTSPTSRRFRLILGLGVWQIGIRAIGYSELVNILNQRNPIFTTIVTMAGNKTLKQRLITTNTRTK